MSANTQARSKLTVTDLAFLSHVRDLFFSMWLWLLLPSIALLFWQFLEVSQPFEHLERIFVLLGRWAVVVSIQLAIVWFVLRALLGKVTLYLSRFRGFTQEVGHELSAPLGLLDFRLQLLERKLEEVEAENELEGKDQNLAEDNTELSHVQEQTKSFREALDGLHQPLARMKNLVEDFRLLAKSERPVHQGGLGLTKVDNLVRAQGELLKAVLDAKKASFDLSGLNSVTIIAEKERMERVFLNLFANAARYIPAGGTIKVTLDVMPMDIEIKVIDNGPGIAQELLPVVFERFERKGAGQEKEGADEAKGSGLGLAIVKAIVESHGGTISAHSIPGCGAEFRILWPRVPKASRYTEQIFTGQYIDD